tara:strand:- start:4732 stop:5715 length:984 start_codon:yes stop_codon:yes gene_type:complete
MKILILGCGSFAGQAIFSQLLKDGFDVYGINRSGPKNIYMWEWLRDQNIDNRWFQLNICNNIDRFYKIFDDISPTHVIDLMGQGMVAPSWEDPALWYETNISKKALLLNHLKDLKSLQKYIRVSTPEVFGNDEKYLLENSQFKPSTPYAVSHAAIDYHLRCLGKQFNFPYCIGRFANFYGPGQQLYRVIPKAIICFLTKDKFILDGGGKSKRSFLYSEDIVSAIYKLLFESKIYKEYNFSSNEEISIKELIERICNLLKVDFNQNVLLGEERIGKDMFYRMNCKNSSKELNWKSNILLEDGLIKTIDWIIRNLNQLRFESSTYIHRR